MLLSTQVLIAAFEKRRQFLRTAARPYNPRIEAILLKDDARRIGSKRQRRIVMFNFG
jgi:hypothetical protein